MSFSASSSVIQSAICQRNVRSIESINLVCKRRLWSSSDGPSSSSTGENLDDTRRNKKQTRLPKSLLNQFQRKKALSVTDLTSSEWCEKQMELELRYGKRRNTYAMKVGRTRHEKLEEEVVKKVKIPFSSDEDVWACKLSNFIVCANQLLRDGLTRELPIVGCVSGIWMVGMIDEIQMPVTETTQIPSLIETKTRTHATLPAEPQKRNARFQLMCYKYLWDNVVTNNFPSNKFYKHFGLNPSHILPKVIQDCSASTGFSAKTLEDLVIYFKNTCCTLPTAHDQLLLRYEFQGDNSLLGEEHFIYDSDLLNSQIYRCLEFLLGKREANYVPTEERWKCGYCQYASICPSIKLISPDEMNCNSESTTYVKQSM